MTENLRNENRNRNPQTDKWMDRHRCTTLHPSEDERVKKNRMQLSFPTLDQILIVNSPIDWLLFFGHPKKTNISNYFHQGLTL